MDEGNDVCDDVYGEGEALVLHDPNMSQQICFICAQPAKVSATGSRNDNKHVVCDRCGEYEITHELMYFWDKSDRDEIAPVLSGLCRELCETGQEAPVLMTTNLIDLTSRFPVPSMEDLDAKLEKLLSAVKRKSDHFGKMVELARGRDNPLAYAKNDEEFFAFIDQLVAMELLELKGADSGTKFVTLAAEGWKRFSQMSADLKSNQVFIATWFDSSMDESIRAIETAIKECGFLSVCIKTELFKETIMDKALGELRRSRFAIIDLTGGRPSVFYEAGFAKALDIEAVYVYRKGQVGSGSKLEFYVKHYQCHEYTSSQDLKEIVMNTIRARIRS